MNDPVETIEHNGYVIKMYQDTGAANPRKEFDHFGTMICNHSRYDLGDKDGHPDDVPQDAISLPLYLYDHGGITMNTEGFHCPWDSGQVGVIYAEREKVLKEYGGKRITKSVRDKVVKVLKGEVEEYDAYLRGDVYGFVIEDNEGNEVSSCWGFYGSEYCLEEAKNSVPDNSVIGTYSI